MWKKLEENGQGLVEFLEFTGRAWPKSIGKRAGTNRKKSAVLISSPHLPMEKPVSTISI